MTAMQGNLLGIGIGNAVVALALAVGLWSHVPAPRLLPWLGLQLIHSTFSVWAWWRVRGRQASVRSAPRRARASVAASALSGLLWAAAVPLFWPPDRLDLQLLLVTMITGLVSGAVHSLSGHLPAFLAFYLPNVAAVVGMCLWQGGTLHALIALTAAIYGATGARFAYAMHEVQRRAIEQREELAALAADLAAQKERAESASASKSRFLAAASHDIRQPVHALNLFLGAFDDRALQGRNAQLIGPLRESAAGLREMLDGVLDLSRAESGTVDPRPQPMAVQALLDLVEREFAPSADARGLLLRTVPSREWIHADAMLTERIVRNLVGNAIRYTAQGGVLVGARRRGSRVALEVWDTGPGIAEAEQRLVFEEFHRGSGAAARERSGLGLGLAIARRFAQAQGATLELRSRPGRGSVFRLALPRAEPALTAAQPQAASPVPLEAALAGRRVLVVDDDPLVLQATAAVLVGWGMQVQLALRPDEVAALSRRFEPQVLITDNDFDGIDRAAEVWRCTHQAGTAPACVVLTGHPAAESLKPLRAAGAAVLGKPADPAALLATLHRLLFG